MNEKKDKIEEQKKQYRDKNKDKIKEYTKTYYHSNKEKLLEDKKQKTICECGCIISNNHISRHRKSKKHLGMIEQNLGMIEQNLGDDRF